MKRGAHDVALWLNTQIYALCTLGGLVTDYKWVWLGKACLYAKDFGPM